MFLPRDSRLPLAWAAVAVAAALVFTLFPSIDLAVSRVLHGPEGFVLAGVAPAERLRQILWRISELPVVLALLALALAAATGARALWLPARLWAFVLALYVVGPLVVVNLLLKAHWGRARPDAVVEFGGEAAFTPALRPAAECMRNCSFVSGEVAAAAALSVTGLVILRHLGPRLGRSERRAWTAAALAVTPVVAVLRIGTGRHFLSDAVFAVLIVLGVALLLDRLWQWGREGRGDA